MSKPSTRYLFEIIDRAILFANVSRKGRISETWGLRDINIFDQRAMIEERRYVCQVVESSIDTSQPIRIREEDEWLKAWLHD